MTSRHSVAMMVRDYVAKDPGSMSDILSAATEGMNDALQAERERSGKLDAAWKSALLVMMADRITPGLKKTLAHTLLPVIEMNSAHPCKAELDAKAMIEGMA